MCGFYLYLTRVACHLTLHSLSLSLSPSLPLSLSSLSLSLSFSLSKGVSDQSCSVFLFVLASDRILGRLRVARVEQKKTIYN
jgi:hypothetical protein